MSLVPDITICIICMKKVLNEERGIQCESECDRWFHASCAGISDVEYRKLSSDDKKKWFCNRFDCTEVGRHPLNILISNFETISTQMAAMLSKLNDLTTIPNDISSINDSLVQVNEKLSNLEPRIIDSEKRIQALEDEVRVLKTSNSADPTNIESVLEEINDRERRTRNILIYNLPESTSNTTSSKLEHDKNLISKLTSTFCTSDSIDSSFKCHRIGQPSKDKNKPRPIKVMFKDPSVVTHFWKKFDQSRIAGIYPDSQNVSVGRDRTPAERKYLSELRETLKSRTDSGELDLTIKFINGAPKIIKKTSKNGDRASDQ